MKIHDVSLTVTAGMTTWGDEPGPELRPFRRIANGGSSNVSTLTLSDHTGTHVDPPRHFIEGAATADALPLDALIGPCVVVAYPGDSSITAEWLATSPLPAQTRRILFKTRNSRLWADPSHRVSSEIVGVGASAARWCVDRGVRLVGIDYLTIEPQGPEKAGHPTHHALLEAGVVIVEGLDLRTVEPGSYDLVCAPLKIGGGDGAPARVFLLER